MNPDIGDKERNPFSRSAFRRWFRAETYLVAGDAGGTAIALALLAASGSAAVTGRISAVVYLAGAVASLVGGHLGDLVPRRHLLLRSVLVAIVANLLIIGGVSGELSAIGRTWLLVLLTLGVVLAEVAIQFGQPVLDASLKNIITPEEYPRASSAAHARSSILSVVAEPVSGFLYSLGGWVPFAVRAACGAGFVSSLTRLRVELGPGVPLTPPNGVSTHESLRRGTNPLRTYVTVLAMFRRERDLLALLVATPLVNVLVFSGMRWSVYELHAERVSALVIGLVSGGFAVGMLVGSLLAPRLTDRFSARTVVVCGLGAMTVLSTLLFFTAHHPVLMFLLAFAAMLPSAALNACLFGHVFTRVPDDLQARTIAVFIFVSALGGSAASWSSGLAVESGRTGLLTLGVAACGVCGVALVAASVANEIDPA